MPRFAVIVTVVLTLFATACGGDASPNPLEEAAARTEQAGSARVVSVIRGNVSGLAFVHRRFGVVDYERGLSSITQQSTRWGRQEESSRRLQIGDVAYTEAPAALSLPPGKQWLRTNEATEETSGSSDPTRLLGYLREWTTDVSLVGRRAVQGVQVTVYRGELDQRSAVENDLEARGWSESAIEQFLGDELKQAAGVEAFVGGDGLIRRVVVTSESSGSEESETLDLSDFGVRVVVAAPPAGAVVDASNLDG